MLDQDQSKNKTFRIILIFILAAIYFFAGKLSLNFAFLHQSASPFWLPTGISLTAFILRGYKIWPAIFIGAFFVNLTTAGTAATSFGIALGNTLEGVAGLYFIKKYIGEKNIFEKPLNIFKYAFFVGLLSTIVSAIIGVSSLYLGNFVEPDNFFPVLTTWWLGDFGGALIIAPVLLLWAANYKISWKPRKIMEAFLILFLLIVTSAVIFINPASIDIKFPLIVERYPFPFITFPIIILIAFRFSLRETATAIFIFALIAVIGTVNGSDRMAYNDLNLALINLQLFTSFIFLVKMSVASTIEKQRKLEDTYRKSEARYKNIFNTAAISIWEEDFSEVKNLIEELNKKGVKDLRKYFDENEEIVWKAVSMVKILDVNDQTLKLYKAKTKDELLGTLDKIFLPETISVFKKELIAISEEKNYLEAETIVKNLNGEKLTVLFTMRLPGKTNDYKNILVSIMDITDRKKAEAQIETSLKEKEILLREIHHRVKNNLQVISSLLNLQSNRLSEDNFREFFIKSQNRIKSIAIVHEMLYKNENISNINFKNYISELCRYIINSYNAENIKVNIISENIFLDTDVTINLGLIINEIISNSVRHAFIGQGGIITIDLKNKNDFYFLSVKDNGKGFPDSFDIKNTSTLGMHLISSLITQIDGNLEIKSNVGTEYLITFKV